MTDSTDGFLIDKNSGTNTSIANPTFERDFIYGEYKPQMGDKKYFFTQYHRQHNYTINYKR